VLKIPLTWRDHVIDRAAIDVWMLGLARIEGEARYVPGPALLSFLVIGGVEVYTPHLMVRLALTARLALPGVAVPVSLVFVGHDLASLGLE
jgi:hypothetical protein